MAQTLVSLLVHIVFSTKNLANLITPAIEPDLYKYISGRLRKMESPCLRIGGTANHLHLLVSQSKNIALAFLLEELKKSSSKWIKKQDAISPFVQMAGRLWRFYHRPIKCGRTQAVY
jgi:putative transposase